MSQRLMGLETELCVRFSAPAGCSRPPTKQQLCISILNAIGDVVRTAPGVRASEPHYQRFGQNGGAFACEVTSMATDDSLLESATPECRSPLQLLLYQRAQEAIVLRALRGVRGSSIDCGGEVAVVKNGRDAEGHLYGSQENYEVEIAQGWRLLTYRVGLLLLVPAVVLFTLVSFATCLVVLLVSLLVFLLAILCRFLLWRLVPIVLEAGHRFLMLFARHWKGLGPYPSFDPAQELDTENQEAAGVDEESADEAFDRFLRPVVRICERVHMVLIAPIPLSLALLLRATAFRDVRAGAMAFLVSRTVVTGSGVLNDDGSFGLSDRAAALASTTRLTLRRQRKAVVEITNLLKPALMSTGGGLTRPFLALFARRQRLQLGISDSNCAQTAEYLKIGTTALVLDMVDAGFLRDAPRLRRPVTAFKQIANDPSLNVRVGVWTHQPMTAMQLQRWYLRRAEEFLSAQRVASREYHEIARLWRATLDALERHPSTLVGQLDWVTKRVLMFGSGNLSHAARKKIDIKYHELGSGYFAMLEQRGLAPMRLHPDDIRAAMRQPPRDTPAWPRGRSIARPGPRTGKERVSWTVPPTNDRHAPGSAKAT